MTGTEFIEKLKELTSAEDVLEVSKEVSELRTKFEDYVLEEERKIYKTQALNENKPEKVIDKIVEGKLSKFYKEACLLEQAFVKDDKITINDFIKSAIGKFGENITIARFSRFKLGETV